MSDDEDRYECDLCGEVHAGEPAHVEPPARSSPNDLPRVFCSGCVARCVGAAYPRDPKLLVAGGQGRSAAEVTQYAVIAGVAFTAIGIGLLLAVILRAVGVWGPP